MGRFDHQPIDVMGPEEDDKFDPAERSKRDLAHTIDLSMLRASQTPEGASMEERRERHQRWREMHGLRDEQEARTDAAATVIYESEDGRWRVRWVLAEQLGAVVARAVTVEPTGQSTPSGGITSNLLRELRPGVAVAHAAEAMVENPELPSQVGDDIGRIFIRFARRDVARAKVPTEERPRTGRPPLPDEHLADVAMAYLDELPRGRGVLRRLGERFDRTPEAMRDQVRLARRRGFLSEAPKAGRKGATPGPRLIEWLDTETEDGR